MAGCDRFEREMDVVEELVRALPEWNDTAKLRGKVGSIRRALDERSLAALSETLRDFEGGLRDIHRADPLTVLITRVSAWREEVEQISERRTASSDRRKSTRSDRRQR